MARPKGSPNKVNREFREAVTDLLRDNGSNLEVWLRRVADGHGDAKPDPGRALDLLGKLAEYAAPKLARTEITGKDGAPVQQSLEVTFVSRPNGG